MREVVPVGINQPFVGVLLWLNPDGVETMTGVAGTQMELTVDASVLAAVAERLRAYNGENPGSSRRVERALLVSEALSFDESELTEKGTPNLRRIAEQRAGLIVELFAERPGPTVIDMASGDA